MIVISQDEDAFDAREKSGEQSDQNGRQFHYELLTSTNVQSPTTEPTTPIKRDIGDSTIGSEVGRTSDETVGDSESEEEDVAEGQEEKENRENENGDSLADNSTVPLNAESGVSATENDNNENSDKSNNPVNITSNNHNNNVEHENNSLAAAFTITMAHDNDAKKVKGQKRKFSSVADFISSKVAARIHLSRPKSTVNITLTHGPEMSSSKSSDKNMLKFNRFNTSPSDKERSSVMLFLERETLVNSQKNQKNKNSKSESDDSSAQIARSRRRHQHDISPHNTLSEVRKKNKASSTTTTTTTTSTTTTTEAPEITTITSSPIQNETISPSNNSSVTHTALNNLVKELNLALTDQMRQLETINETMMSMFGSTFEEQTTTLPTITVEKNNNEANNLEVKTTTEESTTSEPEVEITTVSAVNGMTEEEQKTTVASLTMEMKEPESTTIADDDDD